MDGPEGAEEGFGVDRGGVDLDPERGERVADGVGDRRGRGDRAAFADALDAERVERRRRMLVDDL